MEYLAANATKSAATPGNRVRIKSNMTASQTKTITKTITKTQTNKMEEKQEQEMGIAYVATPDGKKIKLVVEPGHFSFPITEEEHPFPKTFEATMEIKLCKRAKARIIWALNGCKTKKEYRRFKKTKKRINRDLRIIYKTRRLDNPRCEKSLERIKKFLKQTKSQIVIK